MLEDSNLGSAASTETIKEIYFDQFINTYDVDGNYS